METNHFVERSFTATAPDHGTFSVRLLIGKPIEENNRWACSVELRGLGQDSKARNIYGVDSLQALVLALKIARTLVESFIGQGGILSWPESPEEPMSIEQIFG